MKFYKWQAEMTSFVPQVCKKWSIDEVTLEIFADAVAFSCRTYQKANRASLANDDIIQFESGPFFNSTGYMVPDLIDDAWWCAIDDAGFDRANEDLHRIFLHALRRVNKK